MNQADAVKTVPAMSLAAPARDHSTFGASLEMSAE